MWTEIKAAYRGSFEVAVAAPLLFALGAVPEFVQHVVEARLGMFDSIAGMQAAEGSGARLGFGIVKVLALFLLIFWVNRALAVRDGARLRLLGDARSARLFAGVLVWSMAVGMVQLFGESLLAPFIASAAAIAVIVIGIVVAAILVDIYLTIWKTGAALGNPSLNIAASFRIMHGNFWWSLGFFWLMFLPPLVVHYALNILAIGRQRPLMWTILGVDGLVVGGLGIVFAATLYVTARRAAGRKGVTLTPQD